MGFKTLPHAMPQQPGLGVQVTAGHRLSRCKALGAMPSTANSSSSTGRGQRKNYSASRRHREARVISLRGRRRRISQAVHRVLMQQKDWLWPGRVNNYFAFKISPLSEQSQVTDRERCQPNITAKEQASRMYQYLKLPRRPDKRSMKLAKEINLNSQHISAQLFILTINLAKDN